MIQLNLKNLYDSMIVAKEYRQQFRIEYNNVNADCFFFVDEQPYVIAIGVGAVMRNYYFEFKLSNNFEVSSSMDSTMYYDFCTAFGLGRNMGSAFKPEHFWQVFNRFVPQNVKQTMSVLPRNLIVYHSDVEEADSIYFKRFLDNNKNNNRVQSSNLDKTRKLLAKLLIVVVKKIISALVGEKTLILISHIVARIIISGVIS